MRIIVFLGVYLAHEGKGYWCSGHWSRAGVANSKGYLRIHGSKYTLLAYNWDYNPTYG